MRTFILFLAIFGLCQGDTRTWQRDVNFGNPDNWDSGRVPCASDSIKFPETVGVVFFQTNTTLKEIRLPLNGALVLDKYLRLSFTDDDSVEPECDGQEQTFAHDQPENWFDPANWEGPNGPVAVDTENVPCQYDQVIFPSQKLFYVGLDLDTTVGTVSLSGQEYTSTSSFAGFLSSPSGQQQFSLTDNPSLVLQNSQCGDLTGCVCGNDVPAVKSKICDLRSGNCPGLSCRDAPTPVGSCCPVCGAVITMDYSPLAFHFQDMKNEIESKFGLSSDATSNSARKKRQSESGVIMYMSKTSEDKIQMVFTDSNPATSQGQAAVDMASNIQDDISQNSEQYGITSVSMTSSQKGTGGQTGGGAVSGGGIAGIILAVIIIVCVFSTVIFLFLRRNSFGMKDEPLHADTDADIEMSHSMPPGFMQEISNPAYDAAIRGFDNPIYSTTKENVYADPAEVRVASTDIDKPAYVVEEKGAINGPNWEEEDGIKAFTNPMNTDDYMSQA